MRRTLSIFLAAIMVAALAPALAQAGAKLPIGDDASLNLGMRVQSQMVMRDTDLDGDGKWDTLTDFKMRRSRFRLKAVIGEHVSAFIQTELGSGSGGSGLDKRIIDAFVQIKIDPWLQVIHGMNMAPILRQNLTSSGALMAIDRPGVIYKSLTWGMRSVVGFTSKTLSATDSGKRGEVDVRDLGITLFGSGELNDDAHAKYYLAVNDGIPGTTDDTHRITARGQINFFDAEGGYFNSSTYLGKKKTVALGAAVDKQNGIDVDTAGADVDYTMFTVDGFVEWPLGDGSFTGEAAYIDLDLGDAILDDGSGGTMDWKEVQGSGFYVQGGYLVNGQWQPWVEYEKWSSDSATDVGSYNAVRVGLTYFIEGHNANVKVGYENTKSDTALTSPSTGNGEDTIGTFVFGTYITY